MAEVRSFRLADYTSQLVIIAITAVVGVLATFVDLGVDKETLIQALMVIALALLGGTTVRKMFSIHSVFPRAVGDYTAEIVTIVVGAVVGIIVLFVPAAEPFREVLIVALSKLIAALLGSIGLFKAFLHRS